MERPSRPLAIQFLPTMLVLVQSLIFILASQFMSLRSTSALDVSQNPPMSPDNTSLHVTAIVGKNNQSTFQCWKILPDFLVSTTPGIVGTRVQKLGDFTDASLALFDSINETFGGLHSAPVPQFVVFLSGGGYVRLPASGQYLPIVRGTIIIANDTAAVSPIGHDSVWFPGTVALQLPFSHGEVNHTVLNDGPCDSS